MPERSHFVILHHRLKGGEHWDLMLEHGDLLLTWQLEREPTDSAALPIPARRIGDHRKVYLTYEGPVSGDRGEVRRVDAGEVNIIAATHSCVLFELRQGRLRGRFQLVSAGEDWRLEADKTAEVDQDRAPAPCKRGTTR